MKGYIYIAGPYSKGDVAQNVRASIDLQEYLYNRGFHVYNPLLCHFVHMVHHRPYEFWLKDDMFWLERAFAVVRIKGESSGADKEVARANELGIPCGLFTGFSAEGLIQLDRFLEMLEYKNEPGQ